MEEKGDQSDQNEYQTTAINQSEHVIQIHKLISKQQELSSEILMMIFIMICTYQCSQLIQKRKIALVIKSNFISIIIGVIVGIIALIKYESEELGEMRRNQAFLFKVFLVPPILYETVYTLKKDIVILERLGTISLSGLVNSLGKIIACTLMLYAIQILNDVYECLLLSISIFATENFHMINQMGECGLKQKQIIFMQSESLFLNTMLIILSYTFHPFAMHQYQQVSQLLFRLFANVFFSNIIGMGMAFISSYSLKQSYQKLSTTFDNFDVLMMLLSPILSYLMAETFNISGLLALMSCAFIQSIYGKKNLEKDRSQLLLNAFRALSYFCRSFCDILMGIGFALHLKYFKEIGPLYLILSVIIIQCISFACTWLSNRKFQKANIISNFEEKILLLQNNSRGLLCYTLALQNFNATIAAISLLNILINNIIIEPISHFYLNKFIKQENSLQMSPQGITDRQDNNNNNQDSTDSIQQYGCFKSCLLNLHFFTLSNWLVKNNENNSQNNFEKFEESMDTNSTQIELSKLSFHMRMKSNRSMIQGQGSNKNDQDLYTRTTSLTYGSSRKSSSARKIRRRSSRNEEKKQNHEEMKLKFTVFQ